MACVSYVDVDPDTSWDPAAVGSVYEWLITMAIRIAMANHSVTLYMN